MLDHGAFRPGIAEVGVLIKQFSAAHYLTVDEVGSGLVKDLKIAGLLNVEVHCHERPHRVIHPYSRYSVAVSNEFSASAADDRGIRAVGPDAAEVIDEHTPDI